MPAAGASRILAQGANAEFTAMSVHNRLIHGAFARCADRMGGFKQGIPSHAGKI